jgi:hypothetical protein
MKNKNNQNYDKFLESKGFWKLHKRYHPAPLKGSVILKRPNGTYTVGGGLVVILDVTRYTIP